MFRTFWFFYVLFAGICGAIVAVYSPVSYNQGVVTLGFIFNAIVTPGFRLDLCFIVAV